MDKQIIGKKAKIVCLTEQLQSISIKDLLPGAKVTIVEFFVDHIVYGPCYNVHDGLDKDEWTYVIPLKWLEIIS